MLNHARTLLMNIDCPTPQGMAYPGDELIAPGYRALELPTFIDTIRMYLYGPTPDRYMLNYRTRQLLAVMHASPLEEFLLKLDPRVTYRFDDETLVGDGLFTPGVVRVTGAPTDRLTVTGEPAVPDVTGKTYHAYSVEIQDIDVVHVGKLQPPFQKAFLNFALDSNGVSGKLPLQGSGYSFRLNTTNVGAGWRVEILNRPRWSLGHIVGTLQKAGEPVMLQLFGVKREEPYLTFRNLWYDAKELPLQLGGLVAALIYRTEERRLGRGA